MIFAIPLAVAGCERDLVDALVRVVAHQRVVRVRVAVLDVDVLVLVEKAHLVADLVGVLDLGVPLRNGLARVGRVDLALHQVAARCLEVEGASQGGSLEEALANLKEALELYFEDMPLPQGVEPPIIATVELSA
ncbi:MAG: hypothetical protein QOJ93_376 [Actinomycetota bacterium]|jgi:orotate phosphoribosyltransferase-like protein|nr:hypothetical protein [Actinomycetota bacterium]